MKLKSVTICLISVIMCFCLSVPVCAEEQAKKSEASVVVEGKEEKQVEEGSIWEQILYSATVATLSCAVCWCIVELLSKRR